MATIKLGNSKSASQSINYAEKRAVVKSGLNCDVDYAKSNFKQLRTLYNKDNGVQAHTIIQSFKPNETTPEQANEIGLELAKNVAKGHQVAVYTHSDTDHIHNHIIINAVNLENGKKYQSNRQTLYSVKDKNDEICLDNGLSVVTEKTKGLRYTLAEKEIAEKGGVSWKAQIREAINYAKEESNDFETFKNTLEKDFGIDTKLRGETLSFKHPDQKRYVRANKLGADYEKEAINHELGGKTRTQTPTKSIDWTEYERGNQLQHENSRNRTSERTYSAESRPISRKYREEQQEHERKSYENDRNNEKEQRTIKQKDRGLER